MPRTARGRDGFAAVGTLLGVLLGAAPALATPQNHPTILLHIGTPTGKNACEAGQVRCDQVVTAAPADSTGGTSYFVYLLARNGPPDTTGTLAGLQCGIEYESTGPGLVMNSWQLCATLEFITNQGAETWPASGGGNLITWDSVNRCQTAELAVAGYFYVTPYGATSMRLTPRPVDGLAKTASCRAIESPVYGGFLGHVSFGGAAWQGDGDGYNPCLEAPLSAAPMAWITEPENGQSIQSSQVVVRWLGSDDDTPTSLIEYSSRLDGGPWSPFTTATSRTLSNLAFGGHLFELRAVDLGGNLNPLADDVQFAVTVHPNQPPDVALTLGPAEGDSLPPGPVTFAWVTTDDRDSVSATSWRVDLQAWSPFNFERSVTIDNLASGWHHFDIRTRDADGALDPTPLVRNFYIRTPGPNEPPETELSSLYADGDTVHAWSTLISWSGTDDWTPVDDLRFQYRIGEGSWVLQRSGQERWFFPDPGWRTISIRAIDLQDLADPTPASITLFWDRREPETQIMSGPGEGSTVGDFVDFLFEAFDLISEPADLRVSWRFDDEAWTDWVTVSPLGERRVQRTLPGGPHRFEVRSLDGDGWIDLTPDFRNFIVEAGPPPLAVTFTAFSVGEFDGRLRLAWSVDADEPVRFQVRRAPRRDGVYDLVADDLRPDGAGHASWIDVTAEPGVEYFYRVTALGREAPAEYGPVSAVAPAGRLFLRAPVAVPGAAGRVIEFQLPRATAARIDLHDAAGRRVRRLLDETRPAGHHTLAWDGLDDAGRRLSAGVYFLRLATAEAVVTTRVVVTP